MYTYKQDYSMVCASKNILWPSKGNTCKLLLKKKKNKKQIKLNIYTIRQHSSVSVLHLC